MPVDRKKIFSAISMHFNVIAKSKGKAEYMCVNVIMLPASFFDIYEWWPRLGSLPSEQDRYTQGVQQL